ncbi:hypothetical protein EBZ80_17385 [bacterium]|nr:hypothetical protein [bacterium]
MAGSFIIHAAIPAAILLALESLGVPSASRMLWLIGALAAASFAIQFGLLTVLQQTSCSGVKEFGGVLQGAAVGALLTGAFAWLPTALPWLRLLISQIFMRHRPLATPGEAAAERATLEAAGAVRAAEGVSAETVPVAGGISLEKPAYDLQTFAELRFAVSYMAAFAGAYGTGIGSLWATRCPAVA